MLSNYCLIRYDGRTFVDEEFDGILNTNGYLVIDYEMLANEIAKEIKSDIKDDSLCEADIIARVELIAQRNISPLVKIIKEHLRGGIDLQ